MVPFINDIFRSFSKFPLANGVNRRYFVIVIMLPLTVPAVIMLPLTVPAVNKQLFHVKITQQI